jgi:hypothetical protein
VKLFGAYESFCHVLKFHDLTIKIMGKIAFTRSKKPLKLYFYDTTQPKVAVRQCGTPNDVGKMCNLNKIKYLWPNNQPD